MKQKIIYTIYPSSSTTQSSNELFDRTYSGTTFQQDYAQEIADDNYPVFAYKMQNSIMSSIVESGTISDFEPIYNEYVSKFGKQIAAKMLMKMMAEYFENPLVIKGLLHLISHREYEEFGENIGVYLSILILHKDKRIKKFALKVVDNWDRVEMLPFLRGTQEIKEYWLEEYRKKIVDRLEKKNAVLCACD